MKRASDIVVSTMLLMLLAPLMLVLALIIRRSLGTPVLFRQLRPGLHERTFTLLKFRTMREAYDQNGAALSDSMRLTPFGRTLRAMSLDELPSLWNVLKGDMSLVGPRPLLIEYLPLYDRIQRRRHDVRPGITGWAQVNGRNDISWNRKFELDVWYVDHCSLLLDIRILALTVLRVLTRSGITKSGYATTDKFMGNRYEEN